MKVSLNTVKQYTSVDLSVDELVAKINQQLGGVEEVVNLGERYKGAVIAKIVSCDDHPDADRLHVCKIDDGGVTPDVARDSDGLVQVVCGAPNARAGIMVVWLPPGSMVPSSFADAEPFVLSVRPLRGVDSNGMLASPHELGIGDSHEGILEINSDEWRPNDVEIKPGADFAKAYGLDDTIIDIENKMFTHRPDLFGQIGVAREIAGIQHKKFTSPEWYWKLPTFGEGQGLALEVFNEASEKVPRFMSVAIKDVTVKPSPLWLQIELVRLGSKPINNIVDVTNYVMLLTAQPVHAYDYDKLRGGKLGARLARAGEQVTLLNHKTYELDADDIVIVDGEGPVGLAGIMGGGESEVSDDTKNIVLEVATFDMYTIRKSSMRHGVFTDALARFNKGQSPLQNDHVLNLLMMSIHDVAGGEQASSVADVRAVSGETYDSQTLHSTQVVQADFINERLGLKLTNDEICELLHNVEFAAFYSEEDKGLSLTVPFWRTDIELPEDIVEEVGRLYGFDKLPRELPSRSIKPAPRNKVFALKQALRSQLSRLGANEILTYSFVHENIFKRAGQDSEKAFKLGNALSPDLQYYRVSLLPSLLDKVHANLKAGYDSFALYELGKSHLVGETDPDDSDLPREFQSLGFVHAAKQAKPGAPYYAAKEYLSQLLDRRHVSDLITFEPLSEAMLDNDPRLQQLAAPFEPGRSAVLVGVNGTKWGVVGEFKVSVRKAFKLPDYAAGFETDLLTFVGGGQGASDYIALPKYPKVWQDISLRVASDLKYQDLFTHVESSLKSQEADTMLSSLTPVDIYQREDDKDHKHITLRYSVASYDKTMTDTEVTGMLDTAASAAHEKFQAERI